MDKALLFLLYLEWFGPKASFIVLALNRDPVPAGPERGCQDQHRETAGDQADAQNCDA